MRQKDHPVYLVLAGVLSTRSEEKLIKFRNLRKKENLLNTLKLQMNLQISLHTQGPMPKKIDQRFFYRMSQKVHKFKIMYLCSENRKITKLSVIC